MGGWGLGVGVREVRRGVGEGGCFFDNLFVWLIGIIVSDSHNIISYHMIMSNLFNTAKHHIERAVVICKYLIFALLKIKGGGCARESGGKGVCYFGVTLEAVKDFFSCDGGGQWHHATCEQLGIARNVRLAIQQLGCGLTKLEGNE